MKLRNPLSRPVRIRYFHAEALVKKRVRNFIDKKVLWFDGPSEEAAAKGLRKIMICQGYRLVRTKPVMPVIECYYIPMWSLAFWWPPLTTKYMRKKGFAAHERV